MLSLWVCSCDIWASMRSNSCWGLHTEITRAAADSGTSQTVTNTCMNEITWHIVCSKRNGGEGVLKLKSKVFVSYDQGDFITW